MKSIKYIIGKDTKFDNFEINSIYELQDYDIITVRNGCIYMFFKNKDIYNNIKNNNVTYCPVFLRDTGCLLIEKFNLLTFKRLDNLDADFDIIEVYRPYIEPKIKDRNILTQDYLKKINI